MIAAAVLAASAIGTVKPALPPVVYQAETRDYVVRLRIAPELKALPAVYVALTQSVRSEFATFETAAAKDMAKWRADSPDGPMARNPEVDQAEVDFVARTPHLIGFVRRDYYDAHGAHGGYAVSGMLYDLRTGRRLAATELLRPGVDMAPLNAALVARAAAARRARGFAEGLNDGFVKPGTMTWSAKLDLSASYDLGAKGAAARTALQPFLVATILASSRPQHAAGLQFLFSPYDIGAFVEGAYRVVLPARVFAADLKPRYRQDFAGAPAGDLASDPLATFPADVPPIVQ